MASSAMSRDSEGEDIVKVDERYQCTWRSEVTFIRFNIWESTVLVKRWNAGIWDLCSSAILRDGCRIYMKNRCRMLICTAIAVRKRIPISTTARRQSPSAIQRRQNSKYASKRERDLFGPR